MSIGVNRSIIGDDDVLFEPVSWHIKIDFIHQFILNNNVLISVLGEKGTGKSTFAQLLQDTVMPDLHSVMLTATPLFESLPFIEQICLQLDLDMKLTFSDLVADINSRECRTLMIIDNAEELPESFVKEILDALMQQEGSGYCHVCLVSDFSLVKMTSRIARETYIDMIHSIELQPLNEAESKAYVLMRMAALDANKMELSDEWLQEFYELTDGNIMGMNTQMMGFFANKFGRTTPIYQRYLSYAYIPIFILATAGVVFFISSQAPSDAPQLAEQVKDSMQSVELELPLTSEIPFYEVASLHQLIQMTNTDIHAPVDKPLVVMDQVTPIQSIESVQSVAKAHQKHPIAKRKLKIHVATSSKMMPAPQKTALASGQFTIQLLATRDKNELTRLTKQYRASEGFKIRRFDHQGVVWYVLTQGDFSKKELAQQAIKALPKNIAQMKPWVRSTSLLKNIG